MSSACLFAARSSDRILKYSLLEANGDQLSATTKGLATLARIARRKFWVNKSCRPRDIPFENLPLFDKINLQYPLMPLSRSTLCVIAAG